MGVVVPTLQIHTPGATNQYHMSIKTWGTHQPLHWLIHSAWVIHLDAATKRCHKHLTYSLRIIINFLGKRLEKCVKD